MGDTVEVPIDDLRPYEADGIPNPRRGQVERIRESIRSHGIYRAITAQVSTGMVLTGNHTWLAAKAEGLPTIKTTWLDVDDEEAKRIVLVDNRLNDLASYDDEALVAMLGSLPDLTGTGFDPDEFRHLQDEVEARGTVKDPHRRRARTTPVDLIFSANPTSLFVRGCVITMGWLGGCSSAVLKQEDYHGLSIDFVDNEFKDYDHAHHLAVVAHHKPLYATTMDAFTREQASTLGIDHHPLGQVLEWAAEVNEHAAHTIVVPKYDCLDEIPDDYVLGYSIPTSYGGTPLPLEAFAGRRVHLLGGSWKRQREALLLLGDDVVSLDNNYILKQARFGNFTDWLGNAGQLEQIVPVGRNVFLASLVLSMASITHGVRAMFEDGYAAGLDPLESFDEAALNPGGHLDDEPAD